MAFSWMALNQNVCTICINLCSHLFMLNMCHSGCCASWQAASFEKALAVLQHSLLAFKVDRARVPADQSDTCYRNLSHTAYFLHIAEHITYDDSLNTIRGRLCHNTNITTANDAKHVHCILHQIRIKFTVLICTLHSFLQAEVAWGASGLVAAVLVFPIAGHQSHEVLLLHGFATGVQPFSDPFSAVAAMCCSMCCFFLLYSFLVQHFERLICLLCRRVSQHWLKEFLRNGKWDKLFGLLSRSSFV